MEALDWQCGDLNGDGIIIGVIHGGSGTPLTVVRPCRIGVTTNMALNMYESLHLTNSYLLKDVKGNMENNS